jgi:hypothetical protein
MHAFMHTAHPHINCRLSPVVGAEQLQLHSIAVLAVLFLF